MSFLSTLGSKLGAGLAGKIEDAVLKILDPFIKQFKDVFTVVTHIADYTLGIVDDATKLFDSVTDEIDQIVHFKFVAEWKNRVIQVNRVFDNIQQLIAIPATIVTAFKNLVADIGTRFKGAAAAEAVEEVIPGAGQVLGIITIISQVLVTVKNAIRDLQSIVDSITTVRKDITNLNLIFLPNKNPRKTEKLADGGSIRVRIGSLHSA